MEPVEINVNSNKGKQTTMAATEEEITPIPSQGQTTPNPFIRRNSSMDLDDYFVSLLLVLLNSCVMDHGCVGLWTKILTSPCLDWSS